MLKIGGLKVKKHLDSHIQPFPFPKSERKGWTRDPGGGSGSPCCPSISRCRKSTFCKATPCWFPLPSARGCVVKQEGISVFSAKCTVTSGSLSATANRDQLTGGICRPSPFACPFSGSRQPQSHKAPQPEFSQPWPGSALSWSQELHLANRQGTWDTLNKLSVAHTLKSIFISLEI